MRRPDTTPRSRSASSDGRVGLVSRAARLLACALALVLLVGVETAARAANVTLLSQVRFVRTTTDGTNSCAPDTHEFCICDPSGFWYPYCSQYPPTFNDVDQSIASDFSDFDALALVDGADASQTSSLGTTSISGTGSISADPVSELQDGGGFQLLTLATTTAEARTFVAFSVDEPTPYSLEGSWSGIEPLFAQVSHRMRLTDGTTVLAQIGCTPIDPGLPAAGCSTVSEIHTGTLAPGTYYLEVEASAVGDPGESGGPPATHGAYDWAYALDLGAAPSVPAGRSPTRLGLAIAFALGGAVWLTGLGGWRGRSAGRWPASL